MTKYICWDFDGTLCSTSYLINKARQEFTNNLVKENKISIKQQELILNKRYPTELEFLDYVSSFILITSKELFPKYLNSFTHTLNELMFKDIYHVTDFLNLLNVKGFKNIIYSNAFQIVIKKFLNDLNCSRFIESCYTLETQIEENIFKPELTSELNIIKEET